MPGGDRTGPVGYGSRSGRAAGRCAGYPSPGYVSAPGGARRGMRWSGGGHGWRHWFHETGLPGWARFGEYPGPESEYENEWQFSRERERQEETAADLRSRLQCLEERLSDLEKGADTD